MVNVRFSNGCPENMTFSILGSSFQAPYRLNTNLSKNWTLSSYKIPLPFVYQTLKSPLFIWSWILAIGYSDPHCVDLSYSFSFFVSYTLLLMQIYSTLEISMQDKLHKVDAVFVARVQSRIPKNVLAGSFCSISNKQKLKKNGLYI